MLSHLSISNFALIDHLELDLSPGFNALTGETGAGKSIIVDAMSTLLGGRGDSDLIRSGTSQALIEGVFTLSGEMQQEFLFPLLEEYGVEGEGDLILSRELNRQGRHICRINGRIVTLRLLREVSQRLIDIHNQGEHLSLLRVREHLELLDRFGGLTDLRGRVEAKVKALYRVRRELERLVFDERELARRIDLLQYQVREIRAARLEPGEEEVLEREHTLLANAQQLITQINAAYEALYEGQEDQETALDLLGEARQILASLEEIDPQLQERRKTIEEASAQLGELAHSLRSYRDAIDHSPQRLAQVEERLGLIYNLKRKYGDSIEEILAFGERAAQELEGIVHSEERIEELRSAEEELLAEIGSLASQLSLARREAAHRLSEAVEGQLRDLQMEKARLAVALEQTEDAEGVEIDGQRFAFDITGIDKVEFIISPNPGEPLKPLSKIASGGETCRFMLALKSVLSTVDQTPTLIFDEIDAGLGGRGGDVIGRKLWRLTANHQVLCVTHLPQIASFGDAHFKVAKEQVGERTVTRAQPLDEPERLEELAQMLGQVTESIQMTAQEIYEQVQGWKKSET